MTTVGYGDFYPTTELGYLVGSMCALFGIILTSLPIAVIGSNFSVYWEHNKRRKMIYKMVEEQQKERVDNSQDVKKLQSLRE